jgi:hypothetical protein
MKACFAAPQMSNLVDLDLMFCLEQIRFKDESYNHDAFNM